MPTCPSTVPFATSEPGRRGRIPPAPCACLPASLAAADARASGLPGWANRRTLPVGAPDWAGAAPVGDWLARRVLARFGVCTCSVSGGLLPALAACVGAGPLPAG